MFADVLLPLDNARSTAIAMELGVHSTTVALAVATSVDDTLAGPAAVYGLFIFLTAGVFARIMARRSATGRAATVPRPTVLTEDA